MIKKRKRTGKVQEVETSQVEISQNEPNYDYIPQFVVELYDQLFCQKNSHSTSGSL